MEKVITIIALIIRNIRLFVRWLRRFLTVMRTKQYKNSNGKRRIAKYSSMTHLILFPVLFIYYEILMRIFTKTSVFSHLIYPILFGIALGAVFTAVTTPFPEKLNRKITTVLMALSGVLFIVMCMVKRSFGVYMTPKQCLTGAGGVAGDFASNVLGAILGGLLVILLYLLPTVLYHFLLRRVVRPWQYKPVFPVVCIVFGLVVYLVANVFAGIGSTKAAYKDQYEFNKATETFGLIASLRLNQKYSGQAANFVVADGEEEETAEEDIQYADNVLNLDFTDLASKETDEEIKALDQYVASLKPSSQNKYTGLFEGKNLIMICAEAFSNYVISEELTPTLYRMQHNGIYFSNYYQPSWGGSTSTGEYSFTIGLAPQDGVDTMQYTIGNNLYFTLGNQLQRLGYYSGCYHNGSYDYYSRNKTHENLGYNYFLGTGNGIEDICGRGYAPDTLMFDTTLDTYINYQPFSMYYMTVSGHASYVSDKVYVEDYYDTVKAIVGDKYDETTIYYLCYQYELEKAMETLIKKLEDAGIADNTVICLTSDHYPYGLGADGAWGNSKDYVADLYDYDYDIDVAWEKDPNALLLWSGCLENENKDMACEISTPTYSLDVVPTLSNLFGLEYDSRLLVGRDVFSNADPLVFWNNYSWITDKGKYDSYAGEFYPNDANMSEADQTSYVERISTIVKNKLQFSEQVLMKDYYGVLFGEDDVVSPNEKYESGELGTKAPGKSSTEGEGTDGEGTDGESTDGESTDGTTDGTTEGADGDTA